MSRAKFDFCFDDKDTTLSVNLGDRSNHIIRAKMLREDKTLSYPESDPGCDSRDNFLIEGDNLEAMLLLDSYKDKVDCVLIDPPYNTSNEFHEYDDNFNHTIWETMTFERLQVMHGLLKDSGTIWVTISDDECHYLRALMDRIFGDSGFITQLVWETRGQRMTKAKLYSNNHNHILVYAKNKEKWLAKKKTIKVEPLPSILRAAHFGSTDSAGKEVQEATGQSFDTPKPERLINAILNYCTKENDLVLDSYLGSGTTTAVAHKLNRRYIGIEKNPQIRTHARERLVRIIQSGDDSRGGFKYLILTESENSLAFPID